MFLKKLPVVVKGRNLVYLHGYLLIENTISLKKRIYICNMIWEEMTMLEYRQKEEGLELYEKYSL